VADILVRRAEGLPADQDVRRLQKKSDGGSMKKIISTDQAPAALGPYSQAVKVTPAARPSIAPARSHWTPPPANWQEPAPPSSAAG